MVTICCLRVASSKQGRITIFNFRFGLGEGATFTQVKLSYILLIQAPQKGVALFIGVKQISLGQWWRLKAIVILIIEAKQKVLGSRWRLNYGGA